MSAFWHHAAGAALPVAIGLLLLTAVARGVLSAGFGDEQAQRTARRYLEPLSTWCLIAVAVDTVALGAAGDAEVISFALPIAIGGAAALLRVAEEPDTEPQPARVEPRPAPRPAPPAPAPAAAAPAPAGALWAKPVDDTGTQRGLWSRA